MRRFPRRPARWLALSLAALAACGDSTGPETIDVQVSVAEQEAPQIAVEDGERRISCEVLLQATARGAGGASWSRTTYYWYGGPDRRVPIDSSSYPGEDAQAAWGKPGIVAGDTLYSLWRFWAPYPYSLRIDHQYIASGSSKPRTTRTTVDCGLEVSSSAPAPTITSVEITPAEGEVMAGGILTVEFGAHSELGIWGSEASLSGPCNVDIAFAEANLSEDVSHTATFAIPADCRPGAPFTLTLRTTDAALVTTQRVISTGIVVVDRTPPTMQPEIFGPQGGSLRPELGGYYFAGDSIQVVPGTGDINGLAYIGWEVLPSGRRDSLPIGAELPPSVFVPLEAGDVGEIQLRLWARDTQGNMAVFSFPGSAMVRPTLDRPVVVNVIPGEIRDFAIDEARGLIHLLQSNQRRLTTLSAATLGLITTREIPYALGFDLTPSGDSAVLALAAQQAIGIVDLTGGAATTSVIPLADADPALGQSATAVRVASNGKVFVATGGQSADAIELIEVDLTTGVQRVREEVGRTSVGLVRSLDHSILVMLGTSAWRYDAASDAFGTPVPALTVPGVASLDASGAVLAKGLDIHDASLTWQRRVHAFHPPNTAPLSVLSADGQYLLQLNLWSGIVRTRTSDGTVFDRIRNEPTMQPTAIRVSSGGAYVVTVESSGGATSTISRIDLR